MRKTVHFGCVQPSGKAVQPSGREVQPSGRVGIAKKLRPERRLLVEALKR